MGIWHFWIFIELSTQLLKSWSLWFVPHLLPSKFSLYFCHIYFCPIKLSLFYFYLQTHLVVWMFAYVCQIVISSFRWLYLIPNTILFSNMLQSKLPNSHVLAWVFILRQSSLNCSILKNMYLSKDTFAFNAKYSLNLSLMICRLFLTASLILKMLEISIASEPSQP